MISVLTQRCRIERRTAAHIKRVKTVLHGGKTLPGEFEYLEQRLKNQLKEYRGKEGLIEDFAGYIIFDDEIISILYDMKKI